MSAPEVHLRHITLHFIAHVAAFVVFIKMYAYEVPISYM